MTTSFGVEEKDSKKKRRQKTKQEDTRQITKNRSNRENSSQLESIISRSRTRSDPQRQGILGDFEGKDMIQDMFS
jgi:hypothetical protein